MAIYLHNLPQQRQVLFDDIDDDVISYSSNASTTVKVCNISLERRNKVGGCVDSCCLLAKTFGARAPWISSCFLRGSRELVMAGFTKHGMHTILKIERCIVHLTVFSFPSSFI